MEDVLRVLVVVGLAIWAGWGVMVGLRAEQGRVRDVTVPSKVAYSAAEDDPDTASARPRA